jgi:molybdate transport system substrate-binding protein
MGKSFGWVKKWRMTPLRIWCVFVLVGMSLLSSGLQAAPILRVAAAADLAPCINELNRAFEKEVGAADITSSTGSSGNFYAQIKNGAPFDVFLSADVLYPRKLAEAGLADIGTLFIYAHGKLVVWSKNADIDFGEGLRRLVQNDIHRIAIANPDVAPYGRAAKAALENAGIWSRVRNKLVIGENVAQTAQFVQTENAEVGFVSATHLNGRGGAHGRIWAVPPALYPVIEQGAIITTAGRTNPLAGPYLAFLRSDAARAILTRYGFTLPPSKRPQP